MTKSISEPDLCVIGASEPGRTAAMAAVAMGLSVVLIDESKDPHGLDHPEVMLDALRRRTKAGHSGDESVIGSLRKAAHAAAADRRLDRLAAMNIRVLRGVGRFADRNTVTVDTQSLRPWRTLIATGATKPNARQGTRCLSVGTLHRLEALPASLIIVGNGADAVSAAQSFARLGIPVSLVAKGALLPGIDPELSAPLRRRLAQAGVTIFVDDTPAIEAEADGCLVRLADGTTIEASHLLAAQENQPALERLALPAAGIDRVGDHLALTPALRTTNRTVYAIGRAAGASSAQMGLSQAGVALRAALFRLPGRSKLDIPASISITDPEIGLVGLSESEAAARGPVTVWRWPLAETTMAFAGGVQDGHLKVIADRKGRILGAGMVGEAVRDLVPFWSLAIARGLSLDDLAAVPIPSPALSEASRRLILMHAVGRLSSPWLKRVLSASRWFG